MLPYASSCAGLTLKARLMLSFGKRYLSERMEFFSAQIAKRGIITGAERYERFNDTNQPRLTCYDCSALRFRLHPPAFPPPLLCYRARPDGRAFGRWRGAFHFRRSRCRSRWAQWPVRRSSRPPVRRRQRALDGQQLRIPLCPPPRGQHLLDLLVRSTAAPKHGQLRARQGAPPPTKRRAPGRLNAMQADRAHALSACIAFDLYVMSPRAVRTRSGQRAEEGAAVLSVQLSVQWLARQPVSATFLRRTFRARRLLYGEPESVWVARRESEFRIVQNVQRSKRSCAPGHTFYSN